jgi:hypothetical protein
MIEIHTLRWRGDRSVTDDDDDHNPNDLTLYCIVKIDGVLIPNVIRARTLHHSKDFNLTTITIAGEVEMVNHTGESWAELAKELHP